MTTAAHRKPDEVIAELTMFGREPAERVCFAADIGNCGIDDIDWIISNGGKLKKVTLPRIAVTFYREARVNFWLVEMPKPFAEIYGIDDLILTDAEAAEHKRRIGQSTQQ